MIEHIIHIRNCFYSEQSLNKVCQLELKFPKFKELKFAFITGESGKQMFVYNSNTNNLLKF